MKGVIVLEVVIEEVHGANHHVVVREGDVVENEVDVVENEAQ